MNQICWNCKQLTLCWLLSVCHPFPFVGMNYWGSSPTLFSQFVHRSLSRGSVWMGLELGPSSRASSKDSAGSNSSHHGGSRLNNALKHPWGKKLKLLHVQGLVPGIKHYSWLTACRFFCSHFVTAQILNIYNLQLGKSCFLAQCTA